MGEVRIWRIGLAVCAAALVVMLAVAVIFVAVTVRVVNGPTGAGAPAWIPALALASVSSRP